jgi:flagellar hook-associated protein 1 FlgK
VSLLSTLNIGRSGLQAASVGLETVSHNVANASTDGFHRQSVERTNPAQRQITGGALLGQGVNVSSIRRASDELLGQRWIEAGGNAGESGALSAGLSTIETYFNESSQSGVNETLQDFFDALGAASSDPGDLGHRQTLNRAGLNLAETVSRTGKSLDDAVTDFESSIEAATDSVNRLTAALASVNESINESGASVGTGDLMDQRDRLSQQIAALTGANVSYTNSGMVNVYVSGHSIVSGVEYRTMSTGKDANGDQTILIKTGGGNVDVTAVIGGEIGGTKAAADKSVEYLNSLDTFVSDFSDAMNAQHNAGFDLNGTAGGDLFSYTVGSESRSMEFSTGIYDDSELWAFGGTATSGVGDDTNLKSLIDVESTKIFSTASESAGEFLSSLLSNVASDTAQAAADASQNSTRSGDLESLMKSLTSVDLDQEATSLIEFQAAYQASAKVIRAADELLQTLMSII